MSVKIVKRPSAERGHADHDWLKTYHTFSFASYQDFDHMQWGPLRVINEDRVAAGTGFGTHSHREFEIWSYIVSGNLEHKDSLGNTEVMKAGGVQMTSTGRGVSHSEYNRSKGPVHFIQIWAKPNKSGLTPAYYNRVFSNEEKTDKLVMVVAPLGGEQVEDVRDGKGPTPIHADVSMFASILTAGKSLSHSFTSSTKKAYIHSISSQYFAPDESAPTEGSKLTVKAGDQSIELLEGDGAYLTVDGDATLSIESSGGRPAEFLLFELYKA